MWMITKKEREAVSRFDAAFSNSHYVTFDGSRSAMWTSALGLHRAATARPMLSGHQSQPLRGSAVRFFKPLKARLLEDSAIP